MITKILNGEFDETRANIRVTPHSFKKIVEYIPLKTHGWDTEVEVIVFLFWLACGTSYRVVSKAMLMPTSTVCDIIHKFLKIFEELSSKVVQRPPPVSALDDVGRKFGNKASIKRL